MGQNELVQNTLALKCVDVNVLVYFSTICHGIHVCILSLVNDVFNTAAQYLAPFVPQYP